MAMIFLKEILEELHKQTGTQRHIKHTYAHTCNLNSVLTSPLQLLLTTLSVTVWHRVYKGNCVTTVTHYK